MTIAQNQLTAYFRQQLELNVPDHIFSISSTQLTSLISGNQARNEHLSSTQTFSVSDFIPASLKEKRAPYGVVKANQVKIPLETVAAGDKRSALVALYRQHEKCSACSLGKDRKRFVFGSGNANASVMVIGEAPSRDDDLLGEPFSGAAGELLTKMLAAIKLDKKKDVFLTNILKCRLPKDRNPDDVEISSCVSIIKQQIAIIEPKAILLLGRIAAHALLQTTDAIGKLRLQMHAINTIPAKVTYSPEALVRNPDLKRPAWEDLQKFEKLLKESGAYERKNI